MLSGTRDMEKKVYDCINSDNKQQGEKCLGRNLKEFEEIEAENFK